MPFPPWAVFFCYVPLWIFASRQSRIRPLLVGSWLCQFIATLIGFNWVAYTIREFGFFSWPLSILGLLAFASFANLHIPIALLFWFFAKKRWNRITHTGYRLPLLCRFISQKIQLSSICSFCVLVSLPLYSSLVMYYYPMIFQWNFGYTWFYAKWPAAQTAEIWGFQFINTITLFSNLFFYCTLVQWRKHFPKKITTFKKEKTKIFSLSFFYTHWLEWKKKIPKQIAVLFRSPLSIWLILFICLNFYGQYLKNRWPLPNQKARVLVVQPNIENLSVSYKKSKKDPRPLALSQLIATTKNHFDEGHPPPDFILWPEGGYPYTIKYDMNKTDFIHRQAKQWNSPIVLSATGQSPEGATNSIFVFNKNGQLVHAPYNKTILLAFGEYLPGEKWFPVEKWFSYYGRSFKRGTGENKVIQLNGMNLGFQICYEGLFDLFTRDLSRKKAQILVNVTNDSWYGRWQQPYQHLYMTLSRSIEVRRPLIRGTNTGFSSFVSATGQVDNISTLNKSTSWIQEVPYHSTEKQTIFSSWGYYINQYFLWFLFFLVTFFYFVQNSFGLKFS